MGTTKDFVYDDDRLSGALIRLVELEAGTGEAPLTCSLRIASLDDEPDYNAVSYCWGGQSASVDITCNESRLTITQNLSDALRRFRQSEKTISIWADAICVNQADMQDKSQQVPLMGRIYSQAREVLIWLGPSDDDTHKGLLMVRELRDWTDSYSKSLGGLSVFDFHGETHAQWNNISVEMLENEHEAITRDWLPLIRLFLNPYFTRVWTLQEVALPLGRGWIYCGNEERLPWLDFSVAVAFVYQSGMHGFMGLNLRKAGHNQGQLLEKVSATLSFVATVSRYATGDMNKKARLLDLLMLTRTSLATDPRDKVFGILGLLDSNEVDAMEVSVDYTKGVESLWIRIAERSLQRSTDLHYLCIRKNDTDRKSVV